MRIITGSARGRRLKAPPGNDTRPTSDRIKETIFNILQFHLEGRRVLDLFAGSGQLGLEALSRGAKECVFVDMSGTVANVIRENIKHTGFEGQSRVCVSEALQFIGSETSEYDVILLDPPYNTPLLPKTLAAIMEKDLLRQGGFILAECAAKDEPPEPPSPYRLQKLYDCGSKRLALYSKTDE